MSPPPCCSHTARGVRTTGVLLCGLADREQPLVKAVPALQMLKAAIIVERYGHRPQARPDHPSHPLPPFTSLNTHHGIGYSRCFVLLPVSDGFEAVEHLNSKSQHILLYTQEELRALEKGLAQK